MKKEIVFVMSYPWFSLYQRPNHFARLFKLNGYGVRVIEFRQLVRLNSILNRMTFGEHLRDIDGLWSVVKIPFIGLENVQLSARIKKVLSRLDGADVTFWFQGLDDAIDYGRLLPSLPGMKILDVSDSFPDFFTDERQRRKLEAAEKSAAENVDVVLTTAEILYDKFRVYNRRTYLIKNAVDLTRYENIADPSDAALLHRLEKISSSKVIGYQGGIATWFDFDLAEHVISKMPDFSFLFVGMVDLHVRKDFGRLGRYPNFHYIGAVGPDLLPWILTKIDVGIIPFKINDLIRATNPIKLYEYLAAGKPVVATPMVEVMRYEGRGVVATAQDPDAFAAKLREMAALSSDASYRRERLRIAGENSWKARFEKLLEYIPDLRL